MKAWHRIRDFFTREIWAKDLSTSRWYERASFYLLRALALVLRGLTSHRVSVWASSLTYFTLISVVPFIALVAGVGAKLGVPGNIVDTFSGEMPTEQWKFLNDAARGFENLDFRPVGVASVLLLVYAAVMVLSRVEKAFNEIWGVERDRGTIRRIVTYASVVVFAPALLLGAMVLTGAVNSSAFAHWILHLPYARTLVAWLAGVLPLLATWLALTLVYWLIPYTRVRFRAAVLGGFVGGVFSQLAQQVFFRAQFGVSRLQPVYGAFAAIPIFLVWVYLNWILILLGMEIAYGAQNAKNWRLPDDDEDAETGPWVQDLALRVSLWLSTHDGSRRAGEVAEAMGAPTRIVNRILDVLAGEGVVTEMPRRGRYRLARAPGEILAEEVTHPFSGDGETPPPGPDETPEAAAAVRGLRERSARHYRTPLSDLIS